MTQLFPAAVLEASLSKRSFPLSTNMCISLTLVRHGPQPWKWLQNRKQTNRWNAQLIQTDGPDVNVICWLPSWREHVYLVAVPASHRSFSLVDHTACFTSSSHQSGPDPHPLFKGAIMCCIRPPGSPWSMRDGVQLCICSKGLRRRQQRGVGWLTGRERCFAEATAQNTLEIFDVYYEKC